MHLIKGCLCSRLGSARAPCANAGSTASGILCLAPHNACPTKARHLLDDIRKACDAQSILTGESSSVEKYLEATGSRKAVYQDKTCLLFAVSIRPSLRTGQLFALPITVPKPAQALPACFRCGLIQVYHKRLDVSGINCHGAESD